MTEEQAQKITELLEQYNLIDAMGYIFASIFLIGAIILTIFLFKALKQKKDLINQYYLTLNDEQKKVIDTYKELEK